MISHVADVVHGFRLNSNFFCYWSELCIHLARVERPECVISFLCIQFRSTQNISSKWWLKNHKTQQCC